MQPPTTTITKVSLYERDRRDADDHLGTWHIWADAAGTQHEGMLRFDNYDADHKVSYVLERA